MSNVERVMARRQVHMEIKSDPVRITLMRRTKIDTPDGGWKWSDEALPVTKVPVEVLIMPAKRRLSEMTVNTELGDVVEYPFILLGRHDLDVQRDDEFQWNGDAFQVKTVYIKDEVSHTVQVDYFGGAHNG